MLQLRTKIIILNANIHHFNAKLTIFSTKFINHDAKSIVLYLLLPDVNPLPELPPLLPVLLRLEHRLAARADLPHDPHAVWEARPRLASRPGEALHWRARRQQLLLQSPSF